jgi:hypothetical protein
MYNICVYVYVYCVLSLPFYGTFVYISYTIFRYLNDGGIVLYTGV